MRGHFRAAGDPNVNHGLRVSLHAPCAVVVSLYIPLAVVASLYIPLAVVASLYIPLALSTNVILTVNSALLESLPLCRESEC